MVQAIQRDFPAYHVLFNETATRVFRDACQSAGQSPLSSLSSLAPLQEESLFQLLVLASADFFVGSLSNGMGRTVYQLRMAEKPSAWSDTFRWVQQFSNSSTI